jgi:hypothetical protein
LGCDTSALGFPTLVSTPSRISLLYNIPHTYQYNYPLRQHPLSNNIIHATDKFFSLRQTHNAPGKGPEVFDGQVMHSMDYAKNGTKKAHEMMKGKCVTVMGYLKSAVDITAECAKVNGTNYNSPFCFILNISGKW